MNFLKRAQVSITRQRNKSLLILGIVFILGNVLAGSYAVLQGSANVERVIQDQLIPVLAVEYDWEAFSEAREDDPNLMLKNITPEQIEAIGALPYVKSFDYSIRGSVSAESLELLEFPGYSSVPIQMTGTRYPGIMEIEEGKVSLVNGRTFTQQEIDQGAHVALMARDFAELNQVKVGDDILFTNSIVELHQDYSTTLVEERPIPLKIIGIFYDPDAPKYLANRLIVPNQIPLIEHQAESEFYLDKKGSNVTEEERANEMTPFMSSVFLLHQTRDQQRFIEEAQLLIPEMYQIRSTGDAYSRIAVPLRQAERLAEQIFYGSFAATIIILMLVTILFLRDRKYELGIYLSLGEKRLKIVSQIVIEVVLIAVIGITLSLLTGRMIVSALSESMIEDQLIEQEQTMIIADDPYDDRRTFGAFAQTVSAQDVAQQYHIPLNANFIGTVYAISLSAIVLAGLGPTFYILRLNPKKIMM